MHSYNKYVCNLLFHSAVYVPIVFSGNYLSLFMHRKCEENGYICIVNLKNG